MQSSYEQLFAENAELRAENAHLKAGVNRLEKLINASYRIRK
ncbi:MULTISPECIES: hypothetical protein [unclassified Neochlamydia]|nr:MULTISPECIES: hypothetical protein [unclassified Neochlamydia]